MIEWRARIIANTANLTDDQAAALTAGPGRTVTHHADLGQTHLTFTLEAEDLLEATVDAYKIARETFRSALGRTVELVGARLDTVEDYKHELMDPRELELVNSIEGAEVLGVSRQRFVTMSTENKAFPKPVTNSPRGTYYYREAIERFKDHRAATTTRKGGRPRKTPQ